MVDDPNKLDDFLGMLSHVQEDVAQVMIDLESHDHGWGGTLGIVQVALSSVPGRVHLIDIVTLEEAAFHRVAHGLSFRQFLESSKFMKGLHDLRRDSSAMFSEYNARVQNIVDTQVMDTILRIGTRAFVRPLEKVISDRVIMSEEEGIKFALCKKAGHDFCNDDYTKMLD